MKNLIDIQYIKNVNCDLLVEATIDLNEIDLTKEELIEKLKSFKENETMEVEDFLYRELEANYLNDSSQSIYEEYDFEDLEINFEREIA